MLIILYESTTHVQLDQLEGHHIFGERDESQFARIELTPDNRLEVMAIPEETYEQSARSGSDFKLQFRNSATGYFGYLVVSWRVLRLRKSDFTLPARAAIQTERLVENGVPLVRSAAFGKQDFVTKNFRAEANKKLRQHREVVQPIKAPIKAPISPPKRVEVQASAETATNDQFKDLKELASELNSALLNNENLFVAIKDGRLVLEEEVDAYEEF